MGSVSAVLCFETQILSSSSLDISPNVHNIFLTEYYEFILTNEINRIFWGRGIIRVGVQRKPNVSDFAELYRVHIFTESFQ